MLNRRKADHTSRYHLKFYSIFEVLTVELIEEMFKKSTKKTCSSLTPFDKTLQQEKKL